MKLLILVYIFTICSHLFLESGPDTITMKQKLYSKLTKFMVGTFLILLALLVIFVKRRYKYWKSKGIPQLEPRFLVGDSNSKIALSTLFRNMYNKFKEKGVKHGGIYIFLRPTYMPLDLNIIRHILVTDFSHFMNHAIGAVNENDPLSGHLFNLEGEKWKNLRNKLTPTFTNGKMKMMFQTFMVCTENLKDVIGIYAEKREVIDMKELMSRFTTDVIGSCAFGIDCNSIKNPNSEFRTYGKRIFEVTPAKRLRFMCLRILPRKIMKFLNMKFADSEVEEFFMDVVRKTVEYRETHDIYRKDFMHLLLQLKNRGKICDDDKITDEKNQKNFYLDIKEITAQCFVFFVAGFETSSTTMTFALYELANNLEIQEKLRKEIETVLQKYDEFNYEAVNDMIYLDQIMKETLRKYPPLAGIPRECNKPYRIPGTDIILEKGTKVHIPVLGIHMDPEYHPDPEKFDPDRFTKENEAKRKSYTWLPFGEGPRICIGLRFGLMQTKIGIANIIKDFEVTLNEKTKTPLEMDPRSFIPSARGGIWLNMIKIN